MTAATATSVKIGDLLRGLTPGRQQVVGNMAVVPLLAEAAYQDARFVPPGGAGVSTKGYGKLGIRNHTDKVMLVPAGTTYIVDEKAQNHALPGVGCIKAKASREFNQAMCVQQGQGGYITEKEHEMMLLPQPLREKAHRVRRESEFGRLWPAIAEFNRTAGLPEYGDRGHLEHFYQKYNKELEQFVAEFEPVPGQVGAVVLVNGRVAGVERTPSEAYFREIWRPLIRDCYGALSLIEARKTPTPVPPPTRVPLRTATSLADLVLAVEESDASERTKVADLVNAILSVDLPCQSDEATPEATIDGLGSDTTSFVGQSVRSGPSVVYASLVAAEKWATRQQWLTAPAFRM